MKRQGSLEEISDGRLYGRHDMVRAGCGGCRGCSSCCHGMGSSAILDPLDVHRLTQGTGTPAGELLAGKLELNVVDGIILPNLKMNGIDEACGFLDGDGRCSIHPHRPGVCRLFPLGRYYEKKSASHNAPESGDSVVNLSGESTQASSPSDKLYYEKETREPAAAALEETPESSPAAISFKYFLQIHECPAPNKTKVRVEKWLDQPELARYEDYILKWHNFLERAEALVARESDEGKIRDINLYLLKWFFLKEYDAQEDFYTQFEARLEEAYDVLEL
ncbi:MAG: YkgJ family cysteine cluster protein [Lachnospiraceae bacterium]|nr:YkgJ family cysteine cluster protein [Lachnospiraceae bacterium]